MKITILGYIFLLFGLIFYYKYYKGGELFIGISIGLFLANIIRGVK